MGIGFYVVVNIAALYQVNVIHCWKDGTLMINEVENILNRAVITCFKIPF